MSIFTVIKYPISNPPTAEQLKVLPTDLINKWINHSNFNYHFLFPPQSNTPENISRLPVDSVALLRKLMQEYEE